MQIVQYRRDVVEILLHRLAEVPRFLIFIAGPRQVGKTTLVRDALSHYDPKFYRFLAVDKADVSSAFDLTVTGELTYEQDASPRDAAWLVREWRRARAAAEQSAGQYILVLDEIQKLPNWSETVKGLWDEDRAKGLNLHVVLLGSSPLLMQEGMTESLAGRFELIRVTHWSFPEVMAAFNFDLDDYIYFGGYPGSAPYIRDEPRWRNYVRESLIKPSIDKDILMMTRVDKPALLRQLFDLSCSYSGQSLAFNKMLGQLQDAGNTVTLAHYLGLLGGAGLVLGMQKYAGQEVRKRASVPKLNVLNTALISAGSGYTQAEAKADRSHWGHMVESAVGAHLHNTGHPNCKIYYWQDGSHEVDFVIECGHRLALIEVKSGKSKGYARGFDQFDVAFKGKYPRILVGEGGIPLAEFLSYPAEHWL